MTKSQTENSAFWIEESLVRRGFGKRLWRSERR